MKDKKRVLTIILVLIIIIAIILAIVLIFGGLKNQKVENFQKSISDAACQMAEDEHYTESICEGFEGLCKVHLEKLITRKYVDNNLVNPLTKKIITDDKNSYVQISFKNNKMICTFKEG